MSNPPMTQRHDDIPPYGKFPGTGRQADSAAEPSNAAIRERIVERVLNASRHLLIAIGRDWERCGKAACKRSRRCRGFACEPEDFETELAPAPRRPTRSDAAAPGSAEFDRRVALIKDALAQWRAQRS
jgi:hypothetical protein